MYLSIRVDMMAQPRSHCIEDRESGRSLQAEILFAGGDILILITGGNRPHIGSVALAFREDEKPRISALTIPPHREEALARRIAAAVSESCGKTVIVSAGIHEDDLDADGIKTYLSLAEQMAAELAAVLSA